MHPDYILVLFISIFLLSPLTDGSESDGQNVSDVFAQDEEFPFMVSLLVGNKEVKDHATCGGTIISDLWILTAGFCFTKNKDILVRYGSAHQYVKGETEKKVIKGDMVFFPDDTAHSQSIALLKLAKPIPEKFNKPVVLPQADERPLDATNALLLGWGLNSDREVPDVLKKVDVKFVPKEVCLKFINRTDIMCAKGNNGPASCTGDGGGPVLINNIQWGVIFSGGVKCTAEDPDIYLNVGIHRHWIGKIMKENP